MRELVGNLTATNTPAWQMLGLSARDPGYDLNPGNALLFPWLAGQALGYEMYRFTKVTFILSGGNPATLGGRVYMGFDYDIDDQAPTDLAEAGQTSGMISDNVFQPRLSLSLDIKRLNQSYATRYTSGNTHKNFSEPRTTYGGFLWVAAAGMSGVGNWDLQVDYTVELIKPQPLPKIAESYVAGIPTSLAVATTCFSLPVQVGSAVPQALPGSSCPGLSFPALLGGAAITTPVMDIGGLASGMVDVESYLTNLTGTPTVNSPNSSVDAQCYDQAGGHIGALSQLLGVPAAQYGSSVSTQWGTGGQPCVARAGWSIAALKVVAPLARYLAWHFTNGAARGAEAGALSAIRLRLKS